MPLPVVCLVCHEGAARYGVEKSTHCRACQTEGMIALPEFTTPEERWKEMPVEGFANYFVSTLGGVVGTSKKRLSPTAHPGGYNRLTSEKMGPDGKKIRYTIFVHAAVAHTFLGEPPVPGMMVDHINRDRKNNTLINLRWVTPKENRKNAKKTSKATPVIQVDPATGEVIAEYGSIKEAAAKAAPEGEKPLPKSHLTQCCRKGSGTCGGFEWRYKFPPLKLEDGGEIRHVKYKDIEYEVTKDGFIVDKRGDLSSGTEVNKYMLYNGVGIHVIVAMAFHPDTYAEGLVVDHLDGNKKNNHADNLQWVTQKVNMTRGRGKTVQQWTLDDTFVAEFPSYQAAAEAVGGTKHNIRAAASGRNKTACDFIWKIVGKEKAPAAGAGSDDTSDDEDESLDTEEHEAEEEESVETEKDEEAPAIAGAGVPRDPPAAPVKRRVGGTRKAVKQMTSWGEVIAVHESIEAAARALGRHASSIRQAINKPEKEGAAFGFKWELA